MTDRADLPGAEDDFGIPEGFDPETWQALSDGMGPPPPGVVDILPHIMMMIRLPHPDLTVPMDILVPIPTHILTSRLDTPAKATGIQQFRQALGVAVNQIMNDWADRYQAMKTQVADGTYKLACEVSDAGDGSDA